MESLQCQARLLNSLYDTCTILFQQLTSAIASKSIGNNIFICRILFANKTHDDDDDLSVHPSPARARAPPPPPLCHE